ncbi:hypothetical protein L0128_16115 [candidate division KSB1 bacterium]|nr:hypothetical protein [candidate division KSB1 bacterium]
MKKEVRKTVKNVESELLPEYDFTKMEGGVRGKFYKAYRKGHSVRIHKIDGSITVQHFTLEEGAIMLEPDIRAYFPDSEAVNNALRGLIPLLNQKRKFTSGAE